jgi:hypothetical protein
MTRSNWALRATLIVLSTVAVLAQASTSTDAGIFLEKPAGGEPERLHGAIAQAKAKGVGTAVLKSALTQGLFGGGAGMEYVLDGPAAAERVGDKPSFLFRPTQQAQQPDPGSIDPTKLDLSSLSSILGGTLDVPPPQAKKADEFVLARLTVEDGARRLEASQSRGGGVKTKASVPIAVQRTAQDVYIVHSKAPLEPGEYAFFYGGAGGGGQFWAFGVDAK